MAVTKLLLSALTFGLATAILPRAPSPPPGFCCFSLTAANPIIGSAIVEEDTIGQNRVFSSYPDGYYCFDPAYPGRLYDSIGHTCIVYQESRQFQCTSGIQSPAYFSLAKNGHFLIDGSNNFWACPSAGPGNDGSYLIFAEDKPETTGCISITLDSTANACITAGNATAPLNSSASVPVSVSGVFPSVSASASGLPSISISAPSVSSTPSISFGSISLPSSAAAPSISSVSFSVLPSSAAAPSISSVSFSVLPSSAAAPSISSVSFSVLPSSVSAPSISASFSVLPSSVSAPSVPSASGLISESAVSSNEAVETDKTSECPQDLKGDFLAPNLIIPVSPEAPDTAYGTQYTPTISPGNSTVFSFDVPSSWTGSCSLLFSFPYAPDTAFPGAFRFSGVEEQQAKDGGLKFDLLDGSVDNGLTWDSKPKSQDSYGKTAIIPGNSYTVATVDCQSGQKIAYEVSSEGDVELQYFQSTGPKPIGLWIVKC